VLTALGCLSLSRLLLVDHHDDTAVEQEEQDRNHHERERTIMRMETVYIGASLVGICAAWILIDVTHDMAEQVVPSLLLLVASLGAFMAILACFPEEECLSSTSSQSNSSKSEPVLLLQIV
jgi:3-deoxy-D-arabino-heptulosonate 7-phosphate (DAHP) synthase